MKVPTTDELIRRGGSIKMEDIITSLFSYPPRPPCSYNLQLHKLDTPVPQHLMMILWSGTRLLFGGQKQIFDITMSEFDKINEYINSIGYTVKYSNHVKDGKLVGYNIWFEPYTRFTRCNGMPAFLK